MATVAVLGDIHANLPALEAALDAARDARASKLLHTGNVVGLGPFPAPTLRVLGAAGIDGVRGNFDEAVAYGYERLAGLSEASVGWSEWTGALRWTLHRLDFAGREALRDLPFERRIEVEGKTLALYHANPLDVFTPLGGNVPEHVYAETARLARADIVVVGHTQRPFHVRRGGIDLVGAGSVGMSLDGDPRACIAVLDVGRTVQVAFRRVAYDVERTAEAIETCGLPPRLASWLRAAQVHPSAA